MALDLINPEYLTEEKKQELLKSFEQGTPYPHLVMDNFLKEEIAEELYAKFPSVSDLETHWKGLNENKSEGSNFKDFAPIFNSLRKMIMSPEMSQWIEAATGVKDSVVSDDNMGCGLHQGVNGSFLDVHVDYSMHHKIDKYRRLNLLIYMNKDWKPEEYGGGLEMWNADMSNCDKIVDCLFNRAVVFETNSVSYHGYSKISLPEDVTRKSFFSYYYTDDKGNQKHYHDTTFVARPTESSSKKIKTAAKEKAKNLVKRGLKGIGYKNY